MRKNDHIPEGAIATSERCVNCGKQIAEMVVAEALCCECRYGKRSWVDKAAKPVASDDYMKRGDYGARLRSGFRRLKRHED